MSIQAQYMFVGVLPPRSQPGSTVLVTVWENGEAQLAIAAPGTSKWEIPTPLDSRPTD